MCVCVCVCERERERQRERECVCVRERERESLHVLFVCRGGRNNKILRWYIYRDHQHHFSSLYFYLYQTHVQLERAVGRGHVMSS